MAAFAAWQRRRLAEEWNQRKLLHISALYANTNLDMEENDREEAISQLEEYYEDVRVAILTNTIGKKAKPLEEEYKDNAFMKASLRASNSPALRASTDPILPGEKEIGDLPE